MAGKQFTTTAVKREEFFTIGEGDQAVDFTIPVRISKSVALEILEEIRRVGYEAVLPVMFEKCLGKDDYQTFLARADELEDEDYDWVQAQIETKVMGVVESLGKESSNGTRKSAGS